MYLSVHFPKGYPFHIQSPANEFPDYFTHHFMLGKWARESCTLRRDFTAVTGDVDKLS